MRSETLFQPYPAPQKQPISESLLDLQDDEQIHSPPTVRKSSVEFTTPRTRIYGSPMMAGMFLELPPNKHPSLSSPDRQPNDDEIIIVSVRITSRFGRTSAGDELPSRPQPRSYLRRVSTRLRDSIDKDTYKAVQMPRRDYKRLFRRNRDGNYTGTEPERQWTQDDIDRDFGRYQDMPLRSILTSEGYQAPNQAEESLQ